jgi:LPXTG-motif cell wall-anchored protein
MRKLSIPVLALLMAFLSFSSAAAQQSVSVTIGPGRDEPSGTGTATLTAQGAQTQVVIRVAATNPEMLAHIHEDVCPGVGAVIYPLTNVTNGTSTTMINAPLATVLATGRSINLHKSPSQGMIYVGCGNIAAAGAAQVPGALPRTGDVTLLGTLLAAAGAGLVGAGWAIRRRRHR